MPSTGLGAKRINGGASGRNVVLDGLDLEEERLSNVPVQLDKQGNTV